MPMGYRSEKIEHPGKPVEYRCADCKQSFGEQHPMFHACRIPCKLECKKWKRRSCPICYPTKDN